MSVGCPNFKRCCFCIPLRYGLIVWTYIKMAFLAIYAVRLSTIFYWICSTTKEHPGPHVYFVIPLITLMLVTAVVDFFLGIVLLYAGHSKRVDLLKIYYKYSFVNLGLVVLCTIGVAIFAYLFIMEDNHPAMTLGQLMMPVLLHFIVFLILLYVHLLLRSEIEKLSSNSDNVKGAEAKRSEDSTIQDQPTQKV